LPRFLAALAVTLFAVPSFAADDAPLSRIAFGSCADQNKPQPIWKAVFDTKPELFLFMGDNIYADKPGRPATPEVIKKSYDDAMTQTGYQTLFKTCPVMATWDDHDYGVNDGGADYPHKKEAQQLLLDWVNEPKDSPRRTQEGVYYAKTFGPAGKRVQVIMLDTRYFRSPLKKGAFIPNVGAYQPNTDPEATVLGEAQWKWLGEKLREPAEVRLLVSTIQVVSEDHQFERWANFPLERDRLYKLLRETKANGVIVLSGDRHLADLSMDPSAVGYPLYDVTSSGLNQGFKNWRVPERNRHRVGSMAYGDNFGLITIDWSGDDPKVSLQLRDEEGDIIVQQKLRASYLKTGNAVTKVDPTPATPSTPPMVVEGVLTPAQAVEKPNSVCTVRMKVLSTGANRDKTMLYLNSEPNFRNQGNFTIAITTEAFPNAKAEDYQDKTIEATGVVTVMNGSGRLTVKKADALKVAPPAKE